MGVGQEAAGFVPSLSQRYQNLLATHRHAVTESELRKNEDMRAPQDTDDTTTSAIPTSYPHRTGPIHSVAFLHMDLGIGGAEQLIVQLATVTRRLQVSQECPEMDDENAERPHVQVSIYTTRCDPHHCFEAVQPGGFLHETLRVHGRWLPHTLAGSLRVLCSTVRVLYLAAVLVWNVRIRRQPSPNVIVMDVLPTPLWLLQWLLPESRLLFYCHFPDALLKQKRQPAEPERLLGRLYHTVMFHLEQVCMLCADCIVVNSKFTQRVVKETFSMLSESKLSVLYPALDVKSLDRSLGEKADGAGDKRKNKKRRIVSLNRYERKKNIGLVLEAVAWIFRHCAADSVPSDVEIVIGGGYDTKCVENVEHRAELEQLARSLQLDRITVFRQSISDSERAELLSSALVVVYTPDQEHFGIVPLEAMYAGTPVIAVASGGPMETVVHGETGLLCEPTAESFGTAILRMLQEPGLAHRLGQTGRAHVKAKFGMDRLQKEWARLLQETHEGGEQRKRLYRRQYRLEGAVVYLMEATVVLMLVWLLTRVLRAASVLDPHQSIMDKIVRGSRDEL